MDLTESNAKYYHLQLLVRQVGKIRVPERVTPPQKKKTYDDFLSPITLLKRSSRATTLPDLITIDVLVLTPRKNNILHQVWVHVFGIQVVIVSRHFSAREGHWIFFQPLVGRLSRVSTPDPLATSSSPSDNRHHPG